MIKPTFIIIGAPKCGTTSVWDLFRQHPEVCVCEPKEPSFFSSDENYAKGWEWYESFFNNSDARKAVLDVSPSYSQTFRSPDTPRRISWHLPEAALIYIVRHPLRQLESGFKQGLYVNRPGMPRNFSNALRSFPKLIENCMYWQHLCDYRHHFPDERINVLFFEDLVRDPEGFMKILCRILGVETSFKFSQPQRPRNTAESHEMYTSMYHFIRRAPVPEMATKVMPSSIRRKLWRKPLPEKIKWDNKTREWVLGQVEKDARAVLEYGRKPPDYWRF